MTADSSPPPREQREPDGEAKIILGSREQLLHLLAEASEIEHTLMCSYMYAAFSLKKTGERDLTAEQAQAVERWRKTMMQISVQEMGHLLLVSNLTVAVGGRPHFSRPNFPISEGHFPADVVVRLTPFSEETLEHFIFLERPVGVKGRDGEGFESNGYTREQANQALMPGAQDYTTVGYLYEGIRANFRQLERELGPRKLFLGPPSSQVGHDIAPLDGVHTISDLSSAEAAIDYIVHEGEGSPGEREDSHYRKFKTIREELRALRKNAPFEPAWPAADSPVLRKPPPKSDLVWVDAPDAAALLDFGCAAYGLLLRILVQCFGRRGAAVAADQKSLFKLALVLMRALGEAGERLARLPASRSHAGIHAGMTFTMLRGVEPLLPGPTESLLICEQVARLAPQATYFHLKCAAHLIEQAESFTLTA